MFCLRSSCHRMIWKDVHCLTTKKKKKNYTWQRRAACTTLSATTLAVLAPALDVEAIRRERVRRGGQQLSWNECDSAGVSDDECVSLTLHLPARNLTSVTRHEASINQLCSLQITGSYRPDGNFTLEHPAAQVWLMWWTMTLVCTLGFLAAFSVVLLFWYMAKMNVTLVSLKAD